MFIWLTFCHHLCIGVWSQLKTIAVGYVEYRQVHHVAFEKSDLFFLCILRPLSSIITKQDSEIAAAQVHDIPLSIQLKVADLCMDEVYLIEGNSQLEHFFSSVERDVLLVVDLHWHNMSLVMCSGCLWQSSKHNRFSRITLCWGKCLMFAFWVHKDIIKASQPTICIRVSKQYHHFSIAMNESAKVERLVECSWFTISYFPNGADPCPLQWYSTMDNSWWLALPIIYLIEPSHCILIKQLSSYVWSSAPYSLWLWRILSNSERIIVWVLHLAY